MLDAFRYNRFAEVAINEKSLISTMGIAIEWHSIRLQVQKIATNKSKSNAEIEVPAGGTY